LSELAAEHNVIKRPDEVSGARVRAALCVIYAPSAPNLRASIAFSGDVLRIGRHADNEVNLRDDAAASRNHARLERRGDAIYVIDLGSTNGTWVEGERIQGEHVLEPHDLLRVGNSLFRLATDDIDLLLHHDENATRRPSRLVGGARIRAIAMDIARVARLKGSLLIMGEGGSGKELAARELHELASRHGRFVAVACSGFPRGRIEARLFGGREPGSELNSALEDARGGTLFLDDVNELPLETQAKLVHALKERPELRVVAATRSNLERAVLRETFRADLLERIGEHRLVMPPLREHREDLVPLVEDVLISLGRSDLAISVEFVDALSRYDFPGNVRELSELVKRAVASARGATLLALHLPRGLSRSSFPAEDREAIEPTATVRMPKKALRPDL
jgi:two-component system response regulator AtoC